MSDVTVKDLRALAHEGPTLVLFTAPDWCIPCRQFHPHWVAAQDMLPKVKNFMTVDLGESPEETFSKPIIEELSIQSVPSVYLFVNDEEAVKIPHSGVARFVKEVESNLGTATN